MILRKKKKAAWHQTPNAEVPVETNDGVPIANQIAIDLYNDPESHPEYELIP